MVDLYFIQDDKKIDLKDFGYLECININQNPSELDFKNLNFESDDGERETENNTFNPFEIEIRFIISHENIYDKRLKQSEFLSFLARRKSYYLVHEYMPGKRYPVQFSGYKEGEGFNGRSILTTTFRAFKAYSESIETTMCEQDITTQEWQFSQGMLPIDYEYSFKRSNFSIFNIGDFAVDPRRKHYLKIGLKGESDGKVTIVNKTNDTRFVYDKPLSSKRGETIELLGIEPYKNGIPCGIDCSVIGPLILETGENSIQIQNTSNVEVFFDFRFLYKT